MNSLAREESKMRGSEQAANQASQAAQQMHQNHQRAAKNSSANNSQSQASTVLSQQPFEYYCNTSNHQSQNAADISGVSEQQSFERMPPQSSSVQHHYQQY